MDATFTKIDAGYILSLERQLPHPPEKVWRVLTDRDLLKQWFPADVEGDWEEGAPLQFIFMHGEGDGLPEEELRGEVLTVDPPRLLEFRWGSSQFRCELVANPNGCRLRFSETLGDASWGARNAAGWEFCLDNLELVLQGAAAAKFVMDTWRQVFQRYARKFQPEFGPQAEPPVDPEATGEQAERGDAG